jgi:hypothetical protein
VIPGSNVVDPSLLASLRNRPASVVGGPQLAQVQQSPGFHAPAPMPAPQLSFPPPQRGGLEVTSGLDRLRAALVARRRNDGVIVNARADAIGGGMAPPPDGSGGAGTSPHGAMPSLLLQRLLGGNPYLQGNRP